MAMPVRPDRGRGDFARGSRASRGGADPGMPRPAHPAAGGRRRGNPPGRESAIGSPIAIPVILRVILILIAPVAARPGRAGPGRMRIVSDWRRTAYVAATNRARGPAVPAGPRAAPSRSEPTERRRTSYEIADRDTSIRVRRTNRLNLLLGPPDLATLLSRRRRHQRRRARCSRARAPATAHGGRGGSPVGKGPAGRRAAAAASSSSTPTS